MAKMDVGVINYALYEGSKECVGTTEADLPALEFMTSIVTGAGVAGEFESILVGQMKAMELTLKHTVLNDQAIKLSTPGVHQWELREVQQSLTVGGQLDTTGVKHIFRVIPKKMEGGTLKPQSTSDPSTVASVLYWAEYRNGEKVMELDPLGCICYMDGIDYLASVRSALGK